MREGGISLTSDSMRRHLQPYSILLFENYIFRMMRQSNLFASPPEDLAPMNDFCEPKPEYKEE